MSAILIFITRQVRRVTRGSKRSNCIIFAYSVWWSRWLRGRSNNYVTWRQSRVACGLFHCLHGRIGRSTGLLHLVSYKPNTPKKRDLELIFTGHVEYGDRVR